MCLLSPLVRRVFLFTGGMILAVGGAAQALQQSGPNDVMVVPVSDAVIVANAAAGAPVVRITARTCSAFEAGTGFVVKGGLVATAGHVVQGATQVTIDVPGRGSVGGVVLGVDAGGRDVAIISVPSLSGHDSVIVNDQPIASRDDIAASGHPRGGPLQLLTGTVVGYVESGPLAADGGRVMTVSAPLEPGMSGGPVFDSDGEVVGVAIGIERNSQTGIAVPATEVLDTLRGENLAPPPVCSTGR